MLKSTKKKRRVSECAQSAGNDTRKIIPKCSLTPLLHAREKKKGRERTVDGKHAMTDYPSPAIVHHRHEETPSQSALRTLR